jgi:ADP-ribosylglycohydrolase
MDNSSFWIAIVGLIATNVVSAIGFYFAHKSQRSPLREQLYGKQLEVMIDFSVTATRLQKVAEVLREGASLSKEDQHAMDQMWDDIATHLLDVVQTGGVVLPSDLYTSMTAYRACCDSFEEAVVKGINVGKAYNDLMGACGHVFMMSRALAGADSLGVESLNLHSRDGYNRMQEIGRVSFARVFRALRTPRRPSNTPEE